jgi:hypothetical protein
MAGIALGRRVAAAARGFLLEPASGAPAAESVANRTGSEDGGRPDPAPPVILATALAGSGGAMSVAAAVGVAVAAEAGGRAVLAVDLDPPSGGRGPTMLASESARELEDELRAAGGPFASAAARGNLCYLPLPSELDRVAELLDRSVAAAAVVVNVPPDQWPHALADGGLRARGGLMRAELPADRSLAALAVRELHDRGMRAAVVSRPLGRVASRRALAGIEPGGAASRRGVRLARRLLAAQTGQSLPLVLGAAAAIIFTAVVLTAIGGAVTAKGRVQRAADLAALSGARSMRDDFERLFAPAFWADGTPNPAHLTKTEYLARARAAARGAAGRNDVPADRVRIRFPDADTFAPLTVRARVVGELDRDALPGPVDSRGDRNRRDIPVEATAEAEASAPAGWSGMPTTASGGGYSGPLVYRQGEGMRPDVAEAFDRMAAAARRDGLHLLINSGFRSDAEQAELFEQNPNPTMVAPPGKSLHRCATELDLGPPSAYGWLAQNARRFGFLKRYSCEPWLLRPVGGGEILRRRCRKYRAPVSGHQRRGMSRTSRRSSPPPWTRTRRRRPRRRCSPRGGSVGQPTSQIAPSRTSTGNLFSGMAPVVALTMPASGLYAP